MPLTPVQAWAFSNATKAVVDDFEAGLHASMERAADALGGGGQVPCTRTVPGGVPGPCHFPGKIAGEIPQDQMGYPQKLPWTGLTCRHAPSQRFCCDLGECAKSRAADCHV